MRTDPVQSRVQEDVNSSPNPYTRNLVLSYAVLHNMIPLIPTNADLLKDGARGRLILRVARNGGDLFNWLKLYVGFDVTVSIPHLGLSWVSELSYRKNQGYIYVRVPAKVRRYLLPLWESGVAIPVVISIPPIVLTTRAPEGVGYGKQ